MSMNEDPNMLFKTWREKLMDYIDDADKYGVHTYTCSTAPETAEKVLQGSPFDSISDGKVILVAFASDNTAEAPTIDMGLFFGPASLPPAAVKAADGGDITPSALGAGFRMLAYDYNNNMFRLLNPAGGESGTTGVDGGYYAPSVDSDGNLTWKASKADMPQVSGANIKGPAGADGTPITWQGEWVASNVYAKNDAVSYDGSAWVMTAGPVAGAVPGVDSQWAIMARKGADGGKGVGIASIARTSGTGAAGTTDTYTITLTDGSTSTFTVYNGKDGASGSGSSAVTSVNGKTGDVKLPVSGFGTCATAAAIAIKVVDGLPEDFLVKDGVQLCVKFSNANTAAAPQLSVAGASAPIFDARTSNNVDAAGIGARTHHFVYFSGIWVLLDALYVDTSLTISGKAADAKATGDALRSLSEEKVALPKDESGNAAPGTAGQFAVSDGNGGIKWETFTNVSEVGA